MANSKDAPIKRSNMAFLINQTLKAAIAEYISIVSSTKEFTTQGQELRSFKLLENHLKDRKLSQITTKDMDKLQGQLLKKNMASTVNRHFVVYKHFFNKCIEWKYLNESPSSYIKKKREKEVVRILWEKSEAFYIIKNANDWFKDAFEFLFLTGCRIIELSLVKGTDVLNKGEAIVLTSKKNSKETRVIPLNKRARKLVMRRLRELRDPEDFLFTNQVGLQITRFCLEKKLKRLAKKLGVRKKQIKALRHTYATNLCRKNINLETVRKLLGHSQIKTTQRYTQTDFFELKKAVNSV